jgi:uncharacterized membrane protein YeaQ/YmgE (transglycosylase-associated protein family)
MIGMSFTAFLTLLVISAIWSAIAHGTGYRVLLGAEGYFAKLVIGWLGGWIGSPVLGYWGGHIAGSNVYLIPAILGSIAAIFMQVAILRALGFLTAGKPVQTETRRAA